MLRHLQLWFLGLVQTLLVCPGQQNLPSSYPGLLAQLRLLARNGQWTTFTENGKHGYYCNHCFEMIASNKRSLEKYPIATFLLQFLKILVSSYHDKNMLFVMYKAASDTKNYKWFSFNTKVWKIVYDLLNIPVPTLWKS